MITVACVLKSGGDFKPVDVERLRANVAQHILTEFKFVCLTDIGYAEEETLPLLHNLPGWWSKMELFRLQGPVLYFDLDTVIVGNIDKLVDTVQRVGDNIITLRDFGKDSLATGIVGFGMHDWSWLLKAFLTEVSLGANFALETGRCRAIIAGRRYKGDQDWMAHILPAGSVIYAQDIFRGIYSWKLHCKKGIPNDANTVCFHGKPRPWEVAEISNV